MDKKVCTVLIPFPEDARGSYFWCDRIVEETNQKVIEVFAFNAYDRDDISKVLHEGIHDIEVIEDFFEETFYRRRYRSLKTLSLKIKEGEGRNCPKEILVAINSTKKTSFTIDDVYFFDEKIYK